MNRSQILARVIERKTPWDIVVIGGGATGIGCAVDAASRGFDVLLLEQHDFGKGTSSRSTKLIHGGVRYLAQGNISLVRESLKERWLLLKNAPHVVQKQTFIVPCYNFREKLFYGAGLKFYDMLAGKYSLGKSRILSKSETIRLLPSINRADLSGGVLYYDGQFDDTRLLIDLVRTAHQNNAAVLNYAQVRTIDRDESGKVTFVCFDDAITGQRHDISAKAIINAAGPFSDAVRRLSNDKVEKTLSHSQGVHLVFERKFLHGENALMIPKTADGRVLFCIQWHDHLLVGTTDTPIDKAVLEPQALESEIDFILETAGEYLAAKPTRNDILSVFAGIRPLVKSGQSKKTSSLSRGHGLFVEDSGLITITGGKWTTYRRMAEDAVDKAIEVGKLPQRPSITAGLTIREIDDSPEPGELLHPDLPYCKSDVIRAVRYEMAQTVEDILARRTRALFLNARAAISIAENVAEIMAKELGKDKDWIAGQLSEFDAVASAYLTPSVPAAVR